MAVTFRKAEKAKAKLRLALIGASGCGKTYTALALAQRLAGDGRLAVIDTERGSASLYADIFAFDVLEPGEFSPDTYVEAIHAAESAGYAVIVIDSLSHAWSGRGGALEQVGRIAKKQGGGNSFGAWREVTPMHNRLVDAMLESPCHVIATIRAKTEYVQERDERSGKTVVRKVGLQPVQRDGLEYEFTVVADMNQENDLIITKSRCPALSGQVIAKPDARVAETLLTWLEAGVDLAVRPASATAPMPEADGIPRRAPVVIERSAPTDQQRAAKREADAAWERSAADVPTDGNGERRAFFALARQRGLEVKGDPTATRVQIHGAVGLPADEGLLKGWAAQYGWENATALLAAGRTVADWQAGWRPGMLAADDEPAILTADEEPQQGELVTVRTAGDPIDTRGRR